MKQGSGIKKIFILLLAGIVLCAFCLAGCTKKEEEQPETEQMIDPEIIGTWMEDYWDSGYSFAEDGTGRDIFWNQPFHFEAENGTLEITYDEGTWAEKRFTYSVSGDEITLTEVITDQAEGSETPGSWTYQKTAA